MPPTLTTEEPNPLDADHEPAPDALQQHAAASGVEIDLAEMMRNLRTWAGDLGFQKIAVSTVDPAPHDAHFQRWLARRFDGDMGYLRRNVDKRLRPDQLVPGTVRVISARMNYLAADTQPVTVLEQPELGYVSRYALGRDYHKVLRSRLARLAGRLHEAASHIGPYRAFTDSAPVLEKAFGQKAGIGWMGKHSLLLDAAAGSFFFVGEIFTSLPLPVDSAPAADRCGACSACMTVCPTDAIVAPKIVDATRCISYLTIEHKGSIPEPLRPSMGNRIYGCDDCQLWCPWNRDPEISDEPDFDVRHQLDRTPLHALFRWTEADFLRNTEGSAIRRVSYEQWSRNVAVALGNVPPQSPHAPDAVAALRARRNDASALVREHVEWALARLSRAG